MSRIVIPSSTDWLQSADFGSGTVLVEGRLAELLHPELWGHHLIAAYTHALDPWPWDYSGHGHHATRQNGVQDRPDGWHFDGTTGSWISLPLTHKLVAGAQAMSLWFRTTLSGPEDRFLFACDQTASGGWGGDPRRLLYYNNGTELVMIDNATTSLTDTTDRHNGRLHHVLLTFDGISTTTLFLNGAQTAIDTVSSFSAGPFVRVTLGGVNGDVLPRFWNGAIDGVRFYSRGLSTAERLKLAESPALAYECRLHPRRFFFP